MKKTMFSLGLLAIASLPAAGAFQSGNTLLNQCVSRDNSQFALCANYLKATVDTLEALDAAENAKTERYCGLDRASVGQLVESFVAEAKANPDKLSQGAAGTVLRGFGKTFSCK